MPVWLCSCGFRWWCGYIWHDNNVWTIPFSIAYVNIFCGMVKHSFRLKWFIALFVFYLSANCIMSQFMRRLVFGLKHCHYWCPWSSPALTNSAIRALKNLHTLLSFSAEDNVGESSIVKSGQHTLISKQSSFILFKCPSLFLRRDLSLAATGMSH